jgi:hypothetical protein
VRGMQILDLYKELIYSGYKTETGYFKIKRGIFAHNKKFNTIEKSLYQYILDQSDFSIIQYDVDPKDYNINNGISRLQNNIFKIDQKLSLKSLENYLELGGWIYVNAQKKEKIMLEIKGIESKSEILEILKINNGLVIIKAWYDCNEYEFFINNEIIK